MYNRTVVHAVLQELTAGQQKRVSIYIQYSKRNQSIDLLPRLHLVCKVVESLGTALISYVVLLVAAAIRDWTPRPCWRPEVWILVSYQSCSSKVRHLCPCTAFTFPPTQHNSIFYSRLYLVDCHSGGIFHHNESVGFETSTVCLPTPATSFRQGQPVSDR